MPEEKVVEKHYIEVSPSGIKRFLLGLAGGLGWGVGLTIGTAAIIAILSFFASKIDFVPIFGQFLADVIQAAQSNLKTR